MKNLKWLLQQNSKTPSQNIKISPLFQNPGRKWGSCQLIAHSSMDLGKRTPSSLPRRHRGPLAPQHQRNCPSHCHPLACHFHPLRIFRGFKHQPGVTLERHRASNPNQWPHRKVLAISRHVPTPTRLHAQLQQGIWEEVKEGFFCHSHLHRGPCWSLQSREEGSSGTICMFTLVCTPITSK